MVNGPLYSNTWHFFFACLKSSALIGIGFGVKQDRLGDHLHFLIGKGFKVLLGHGTIEILQIQGTEGFLATVIPISESKHLDTVGEIKERKVFKKGNEWKFGPTVF